MSGAPGSGKITVARPVAKAIGAVVIDHDMTKSALLAAEIPAGDAGRASYMVLDALARHLLSAAGYGAPARALCGGHGGICKGDAGR